MTNEEALTIIEKSEKCYTENCPDGIFCDECPWNVKTAEYDEAIKTIKSVLSKQCASTEQADKKLFGHGYWLMPGEVFISHNVLNEVLDTITKSINTEQRKIDSTLVKTATNDEAIRKDDHIAEPDKMVDQIREDTKKTNFKPGDKFILELGAERKMFDEFEIAGTDLYVETRLLEKLKRYEPEENATADKILIDLAEAIETVKFECGEWQGLAQTIVNGLKKLSPAQPEIIRCEDCKHRGEKPIADGRYWCDLHGTFMYYCSDAERRTDEGFN